MDELETLHKPGSAGLWLTMLGILVVTGLAAWLIPGAREEVADIPVPGVVEQIQRTDPASPAAPPESPQQTSADVAPQVAMQTAPKASGAEGDIARAIIAEYELGKLGLQDIFSRARELQGQNALGDAWLLDFYAARKGNVQAAMVLAQQADPLLFQPGKSALEAPDLVQAHKWYVLAAKYGDQHAPLRLDNLKSFVQARADQGDPLAASLLMKW